MTQSIREKVERMSINEELTVNQIGSLISDAAEALGLFPSVIKSGEHWSDTCEDVRKRASFALSMLGQLALKAASEGK